MYFGRVTTPPRQPPRPPPRPPTPPPRPPGASPPGPVNAPLGAALQGAVAHYVLGLASVYALAIALDVLAPSFGAQSNRVQALKLAAYASTPSWLLAALLLVPQFGLLVLLGLVYTLWLLALGVPVVMKVPGNAPENATAYRLIAVIVALVLIL